MIEIALQTLNLETSQYKSAYNNYSRTLLSYKVFLAYILSQCMYEFQNESIEYIMRCIEGNPFVGQISIHSGEMIEGITNQLSFMNEGENAFDILFYVKVPVNGTFEKRFVNVEIQNNYYPGYPLEARVKFYLGRMLSMQYGREMKRMEYEQLKKVWSIWIMTNPPKYLTNTIYYKRMKHKFIKGESEKVKHTELMHRYMMNLGKVEECSGVLRLLAVLLSHELSVISKKEILEKEYGIRLGNKERGMVDDMCNLADAIEQKGIDKGVTIGKDQGMRYTLISILTKKLNGLSIDVQEKIKGASIEGLELLQSHIFDIVSEEDIERLLMDA